MFDHQARGLGAGRSLYEVLEHELSRQNVVNLAVCITGKNQNSVEFHQHLGYKKVGTFENFGFKFGEWYDVIWLQKRISDPIDPQRLIPYSKLN